jgi:hypothetical protein
VQRRHHYEQAFESYLRAHRVPYVAVDEARKALLPDHARLTVREAHHEDARARALKSFDFVIYPRAGTGGDQGTGNLLIDVKGRKVSARSRRGDAAGRLETWVTEEDISSLAAWQTLFGAGFRSAFAFVYWCDAQPPDGLFQHVIEHRDRWYAVRGILLDDYAAAMRTRSVKWRTVHLAAADFDRLSRPLMGDLTP